jgi:ATP-dependent Clp protease ATP-binding subunit ClpC
MFERFTDYARRVVLDAQDEACALGHTEVDTDHLLLGLTSEREAAAAAVLESQGGWHDAVLDRVVADRGRAEPLQVASNSLPFSRDVKRVLELALRESLQLGQNHLGTEHLLLGLLSTPGCRGTTVLIGLGVDLETARQELIRVLAEQTDDGAPAVGRPPTCPRCGHGLAGQLRSTRLDASTADGSTAQPVVVVYCGECGIALSGWPG